MKNVPMLLLAVSTAFAVSCASRPTPSPAPGYQTNSFDNDLPLDQVPPAILAAAKAQIPGLRIEDADLQQHGAARLYELDGTANGRNYEITVSSDARVLHVESE